MRNLLEWRLNAAASREYHRLVLALGSNIAPEYHLPKAIQLLARYGRIEAISSAWETPAYGSPGPDFLNAAVALSTYLPATEFKKQPIHTIENHLGRVRTSDKFAPRTIDIDIIIEDGAVIDSHLWELAHVAMPVSEIYPDLPEPTTGERLSSVAQRLAGQSTINHRPDVILR